MPSNNAINSTNQAAPNGTSVGIVAPQRLHFTDPFALECGRVLPEFALMVETYGTLNAQKDNAILICHALSGSHHAAGFYVDTQGNQDGKPGWWEALIGDGRAIDTNRFFVVSLNNLGSCYGSTGPTEINPQTGEIYGADFPLITIKDWVHSQKRLMDKLGIAKWHAVVGGSMGGMQALQWSLSYPDCLKKCVIIASTPKLSAQNIAFNEVARQSILSDPDFCNGFYIKHQTHPKRGLMLARMVGHITYLTEDALKEKFGRDLKTEQLNFGFDVEFQIESYLRYQGKRFSENFDANTYLLMTKALDYFDPTRDYLQQIHNHPSSPNDDLSADLTEDALLARTMAAATCQFLVVSFTSDWRFSPTQSFELVNALLANKRSVSYVNVDAPFGHDSFLFAIADYVAAVKGFLESGEHCKNGAPNAK